MPYDANEPRVPINGVPEREDLRDPEHRNESVQKWINTGPGGTVNISSLNYYLNEYIINKGYLVFHKIKDLSKFPKGSRICYLTKDLKWRSGGFLVEISRSNTLYGTNQLLDHYKYYLAYKAFNNSLFHLQDEDIRDIYIKPKNVKKTNTGPVPIKYPGEKTQFPVIVKNTIIKYCRDSSDRDRFMSSAKYQRILNYGYIFQNQDTDSVISTDDFKVYLSGLTEDE
jgi:hypothetical protein